MMVGKQWVKSHGMHRWGMHTGEKSNNIGYEAESSAATMTLQDKDIYQRKKLFSHTYHEP